MKFSPTLSSLVAAPADAKHAIRFTFEQGDLAGRTYTGTVYICSNPCCPCETLRFTCQPDPEISAPASTTLSEPRVPVRFCLRVVKRDIDPEDSRDDTAIARATVAELQPADWEQWTQVFYAVKRGQMKSINWATLPAALPPEVMDGSATMVGYREVFPWAEKFEFKLAGEPWIAVEEYCVDPDCDCRSTVLVFFRLSDANQRRKRPVKPECVLRYDYGSDEITVVERKYLGPEPTTLMTGLRAAIPDFGEILQERHQQTKQLAKRLIPAAVRNSRRASGFRSKEFVPDAAPTPPPPRQIPAVKPGRNEPCSCGSGKKYKKCCGG